MAAETNRDATMPPHQPKPEKTEDKGQEKAAEQTVKPSSPGETGTTPGTDWEK